MIIPELNKIYIGDCVQTMKTWPEAFVQTCITSPPYFALRDYGVEGQLGLENSPEEYIAKMVEVFREVKRVLRDDGTLWLNIGDSYATNSANGWSGKNSKKNGESVTPLANRKMAVGLKPKDLIGIPWMLAFALRADGWHLRSEIIWHKPNPMPESVTDRPTKSHEQMFLLSKKPNYYYDAEAIKEQSTLGGIARRERCDLRQKKGWSEAYGGNPPLGLSRKKEKKPSGWDTSTGEGGHGSFHKSGRRPSVKRGGFNGKTQAMAEEGRDAFRASVDLRNKRSVWTVSTKPFADAHFATFPADLIVPCIIAGAPRGGVCLDPFMGAGTTALVAATYGRKFIGCELNPEYLAMAEKRVANELSQEKFL